MKRLRSDFTRTRLIILGAIILNIIWLTPPVRAQVEGPHEIKWLRVGAMHSWFSNAGTEIEYGRRTRAHLEDQADLLRWPAQFLYQDHCAAKAFWIGTTNFNDPQRDKLFPYKVVQAGPRQANMLINFMPVEFKMLARFTSPIVVVDGLTASDNALNDIVDEVVPDLEADRMIINKVHSSVGVTMTRKMLAFAQPYHDNYYIYDYVFKNTGIIDTKGTRIEQTLTGVYFHFQYRYVHGFEAFRRGGSWAAAGNISWGRNCVNDVVGQDPNAPDFEFRAIYSWYGPHSQSPGYDADWGCPNHYLDGLMSAAAFAGTVVLHADKSATDPTDDLNQPTGTQFVGSDQDVNRMAQYDADLMTRQYKLMSGGHPEFTHAQEVGESFGDQYGIDPGGYSQCQSFGPYHLEPGDSVHIILAEAVAGLSRLKNMEVGKNWFDNNSPFTLPGGNTTADRNEYKKTWVWSCKDSLFQTYRRAIENYQSGYSIPLAPPPPDNFTIQSGGNQITLTWTNTAETWPNFDGYQIFRAIGRPDTLYEMIFSCNRDDAVNVFEDKTARRGFNYYYYIQTKDDGTTNTIQPGTPLVSSKFFTMTNEPAYLRKPAVVGTLDSIRVVPNPYHIRATSLQFGRETPDRIAFFGLPGECTIKIYTERGDLIETIEHNDGTSDELWNSITSSRQVVVSGLYIALFQTPSGESTFRKFVIIR